MTRKAFNGAAWHHKGRDIITYNDAVQRVVQGFQSSGWFNFGSGEIDPDVLFLIAVGRREELTGLILECGKIRTGAARIILP